MNTRLVVVKILQQVIQHGRNLPDAISSTLEKTQTDIIETTEFDRDRALIQAMCYGVIRLYPRLQFIADQLISKPLKAKDFDILLLILSGLYQLIEMRIPDHAAVSETVKITSALKKPWAKNLVNAVLRNYQRQAETVTTKIKKNDVAHYAHPAWWITLFKKYWPQDWQYILTANNQNPPMTLRINTRHTSRENYLELLSQQGLHASLAQHSSDAITLEKPLTVNQLPLFKEGKVSVQDEAAQLAALLLDPQAGDNILDACAAPGGKTIHILEKQPEITLTALDIDQDRLDRVQENLERTGLEAVLVAGNAFDPASWWNKKQYDRILLDAPCSASGVIRRHPDIKLLRKESDIASLVQDQQLILAALWPLLKSGGMLLYATCSVFPPENTEQIERFLQTHTDARLDPIDSNWGQSQAAGKQILPGENGMDGFFYARLYKQ